MESKQITSSVIARLMGLDELPPRQPIHKQQRVLSENYLRKTASIGVREKRSSYEGCSFRMTAEKHQEFKDIFEVPSIPRMDKHHHPSPPKGKGCSNLTGGNVALQEFTEPKCLLMNETLQRSKEFDDTPEVLDSSNDLLPGNLQEQGSFFIKHLHNVQGVSPYLQSGNVRGLKASNASSHRKNEIYGRLERRTEQRDALKSFQKPGNDLVPRSHEELGADYSHNLSKSRLQSEDDRCISHTRIVVLRPNLGKTPDTRSLVSTTSHKGSQSSYRRHKNIPHSKNEEMHVEARERKTLGSGMEPFGHGSRVSGETANVIGKTMKHNASSSFTKVSRSGFGGDGTSLNEFEVMKPSSPDFINWKNRHQKSFSYWNGFSVAGETKKQLSERWKMTKSCQEIGLVGRGSTLGEMLAMPDHETRPRNLDCKHGKNSQSNQFGANDGDVNLCTPLGISSKDGWKGGCVKSSPKSGSLPASASIGSHKPMTGNEVLHCDWYMTPEEAVDGEPQKSGKQNSDLNDCSGPRNSRLSSQKSVSIPFLDSENNHTAQEACVILSELKHKIEESNLSEQSYGVPKFMSSSCSCSDSESNHTVQKTQVLQPELNDSFGQNLQVPESSIVNVASISTVADIVAYSETEDIGLSFGITNEQQSKPMAGILLVKDGDSASCNSVASILEEGSIGSPGGSSVSSHCTGTNPESSVSLEEAYQPSPVSVLELPFKGEISSGSECFESVSADNCGLQMQLQLLKSESPEAYSEGPGMVISSDEDTEEESIGLYDEKREPRGLSKARESRDFSYLVDVLVEAGFCGSDLEMDLETWHSPECPMSRLVFEKLEKKYGEQTSWKRSERMLLFDRINSGLMEILWPCTEIHMWTGSVTKRLSFKLSQEMIEEELWKILASQEKEMNKNLSGKALGRETRWLELGDNITIIGREIESLLLDELAAEFVSMENF